MSNVHREENSSFWELALATNAAFKGLLGSMGQSGHICSSAEGVDVYVDTGGGWENAQDIIAKSLDGSIRDGDVIVVAEKVVAASQNRIGPREILLDPDPKTVPPEILDELSEKWQKKLGFVVKPIHLLLADEYQDDKATLGVLDHNKACSELALTIQRISNVSVDVIISDTDTGLDVRMPLIGCITIGATPIGSTKGVILYEAMRCAVAAEFVRGHNLGIPIVICRPADRRRHREFVGEYRGYSGHLHISFENGIAYS